MTFLRKLMLTDRLGFCHPGPPAHGRGVSLGGHQEVPLPGGAGGGPLASWLLTLLVVATKQQKSFTWRSQRMPLIDAPGSFCAPRSETPS
jgi:hypothetical protein